MNSNWVKDEKVSPENIILLEVNVGSKLFDFSLSNNFF